MKLNEMKIMKVDEIIIRPFPYTREDKGFYAYVHYNKWTKQITAEGKTEEEAYNKAIKYCRKNNIEV